MNMNHPLRVVLPLAGFCAAFAVMAQTPPNPQGQSQPNQQVNPPAAAVPPQNQTQGTPQASPQANQPSMTTLGGSNNDNQVNQHKAQLRQQAIQMIEQGLNNLRQSQ
jgi:hypothetical protein